MSENLKKNSKDYSRNSVPIRNIIIARTYLIYIVKEDQVKKKRIEEKKQLKKRKKVHQTKVRITDTNIVQKVTRVFEHWTTHNPSLPKKNKIWLNRMKSGSLVQFANLIILNLISYFLLLVDMMMMVIVTIAVSWVKLQKCKIVNYVNCVEFF